MKSNPVTHEVLLEMAGREVGVLLSNGKTVRGAIQRAEQNTLILLRIVKVEPMAEQIQEALAADPKAEIHIGEVRSKLIIPFDEIVCIEGEIFSNLRLHEGVHGNDKRGPGKDEKAGGAPGPSPVSDLPAAPKPPI